MNKKYTDVNKVAVFVGRGALMMTVVAMSACADVTQNTEAVASAADVSAECPVPPASAQGTPESIIIKIQFESAGEGKPLCATAPVVDCQTAWIGKDVTWQAVDGSGNDIEAGFEIYFDPIQGGNIQTNDGNVTRQIQSGIPQVTYKYTVWDNPQGSDPHVCDPLDPRFRVR